MQAFRQGQVWHCIGQHKGQRPHRQHSNGDDPPRQVQWGLRCNAFAGQHKQHQPQQQACRHAGQCHLPRAQFGQQGGTALGVNAGTHVMHPGSPAEERRTDERRTAQVAGGKVLWQTSTITAAPMPRASASESTTASANAPNAAGMPVQTAVLVSLAFRNW